MSTGDVSTGDVRALGEAVLSRRDELGLSQLDVHAMGGPSNTTLTSIETAKSPRVSPATLRKLDGPLRWEPGSARRVYEGRGTPIILRPTYVSAPGDTVDAPKADSDVAAAMREMAAAFREMSAKFDRMTGGQGGRGT